MAQHFYLLAQRGADSPVNQWLGEHPMVLGGIFLAIGIALAGSGAYEFRRGVARDKYGNEYDGSAGTALAIIRIVGGLGACGFAIYKMLGN